MLTSTLMFHVLQDNWKVRSTQSLTTHYKVLVGYYQLTYDNRTHEKKYEVQGNIFDQYYGPLQADENSTNDIFDVLVCFPVTPLEQQHISFQLGG